MRVARCPAWNAAFNTKDTENTENTEEEGQKAEGCRFKKALPIQMSVILSELASRRTPLAWYPFNSLPIPAARGFFRHMKDGTSVPR